MIERILVPLDGSATAEAVLPQVGRLLRRHDSEVILVRSANSMPVDAYPTVFEAALAAAREYVMGIQDRLIADGVRVKAVARLGSAAETILEVAREEKATLIAMATHGHSGVTRLVFGSVAEQVLRKSPLPVLVVRPFEASHAKEPIQNILVPLDGSKASARAVPRAMEMAALFGARVVLLHVLDPKGNWPDRDTAGRQLGEIADKLRAAGISTLTIVDEGNPAVIIGDVTRHHEIDLVTMATHGRTGLSRLVVGSVTESVVRASSVPVLVVRSVEATRKGRAHTVGGKAVS